MGRYQREKGKRWEREVARRMRELFPGDAERIHRSRQARTGRDGADVAGLPHGLWPECKVGKRPSPRAALQQAEDDAPDGAIPLAIVKDDRERPFVVLRLDDFERLIAIVSDRSRNEGT